MKLNIAVVEDTRLDSERLRREIHRWFTDITPVKERILQTVTCFADGSSIGSHGSNAWPKGNGLGRIRAYMEQLVEDGVQIEQVDEE